jgi:hypothetical protein
MRRHSILALLGVLLVVAGMVLLMGMPVVAQDEEPETDFLASFHEAWASSGHADAEAEAFVHWNEDGEVEVDCAKCHSTPGYLDFLGEDGSEAGVVDAAAPIGTTVNCDACHNDTASNLHTVAFPSGAEITTADNAARCMVCHQGRASGASVEASIADAGLADLNTPSADLRFINIHYYAAAATLYGSEAGGGYQYEGKVYQMQNVHVPGYDTCTSCHNPHTLEVQVDECAACHDVEDVEDLRDIRMEGSQVDFDGDGDIEEGIAAEIEGMQELTYQAIQAYAADVAGTPIIYDTARYPYWFADTDGSGTVDEGEEGYGSFTGNLLKAAYNYQVSQKDPGAYAHNPVYIIELLYDSIESLNGEISEPLDMGALHRSEAGHFDVTAEAFRHWDAEGEVPATCTRCHTDAGLPFLLEHGAAIDFPPANSLSCQTCHSSLSEFTLHVVNEVTMPSGAVVTFGEEEPSNVCLMCHQGRESGVSIDTAITRAAVGDDEVSENLRFRNPHYFAAGATLFGSEAHGAYQYADMEYSGRFEHTRRLDSCTGCHEQHTLEVRADRCIDCHEALEESDDVRLIRAHPDDAEPVDYDGNGDLEEPLAAEVESLHAALLAGIQTYAADVIGTPIVYAPANYPYWYIDANGNGTLEEEELTEEGGYATWTPTLLRAAYNYQYVAKDPGAFAHNGDYILQVLYDSIAAISGEEAVASFTRPEVTESDSDD